MVCRVQNIPEIPVDSVSNIGRVIEELAELKIDPESFHQENQDRFELVGECSAQELQSYESLQKEIANRIANLSIPEIKAVLVGLIDSSYAFDQQTGEMNLKTTESGQRHKRELDLWIAAISHRAYEDEAFLKKIFADGEIRGWIIFNSPNMSAADRGMLWQAVNASKTEDADLKKHLREIKAKGYQRLFAWLKGYDGKSFFIKDPFWRSYVELGMAGTSFLGKESSNDMSAETYPGKTVRDLLTQNNLLLRYLKLNQKETKSLIDYYYELTLGLGPTTRPGVAKYMVEEIVMLSAIFDERGVDLEDSFEQKMIEEMTDAGWAEEDAGRYVKMQQGLAKATADPLDNYLVRFDFLRQYRKLYDNMLSKPLEETFSPEQQKRYVIWGNFLLNRSQMGIPVQLADLDRIRWEVQQKRIPEMDFSEQGLGFELRDLDTPHWYMPSDLGLCGSALGGPLVHLSGMSSNGMTVNDLVCNNIELLPFLPKHLLSHYAAMAFGTFGIAIMRNEGFDDNQEWTPGFLLETLTHEASHIEWFRENFDSHSERLQMLGPNERRAYARGHAYLAEYAASLLVDEQTESSVADRLIQGRQIVAAANERLGVSVDEMDPFYWDPLWDMEPLSKLVFQPPQVLQASQRDSELTKEFGPLNPVGIRRMRIPLFHRAIEAVARDYSEMNDAQDALLYLISGKNNDRGNIISGGDVFLIPIDSGYAYGLLTPFRSRFGDLQPGELILKSHPMTRAYNLLRAEIGEPPVFNIDQDQDDWLQEMDRITAAFINKSRMQELIKRRQNPSREETPQKTDQTDKR